MRTLDQARGDTKATLPVHDVTGMYSNGSSSERGVHTACMLVLPKVPSWEYTSPSCLYITGVQSKHAKQPNSTPAHLPSLSGLPCFAMNLPVGSSPPNIHLLMSIQHPLAHAQIQLGMARLLQNNHKAWFDVVKEISASEYGPIITALIHTDLQLTRARRHIRTFQSLRLKSCFCLVAG